VIMSWSWLNFKCTYYLFYADLVLVDNPFVQPCTLQWRATVLVSKRGKIKLTQRIYHGSEKSYDV